MKFLLGSKDGGAESHVYMYGIESKRFGSVLLLRFEQGTREAYHSHAFNSLSLVLSGLLEETHLDGDVEHHNALSVVQTYRETFHKVYSVGRTWVLTLRGPWAATWQEVNCRGLETLTFGRKVLPQ